MAKTLYVLLTIAVILVSASTQVAAATIEPDARFSVANGALNPGNISGIFCGSGANCDQTGGREAFVEFDLSFGPASSAIFEFTVFDFVSRGSDPIQTWDVAYYAADGVASISDFGAGTFLTSLSMPAGALTGFTLDVSALVSQLQTASATHIGFRFFDTNHSQLGLNGAAVLQVTAASPVIPEPSAALLFAVGVVVVGRAMRRRL